MTGAAPLIGAVRGLLLGAALLLTIHLQPCFASRLSRGLSHGDSASIEQGHSVFSHMRSLLDTKDSLPAFVSTPRELEHAILSGRKHIVVTDHLDMTSMPHRPVTFCGDGCESPLPENRETLSIRGQCRSPPGEIDLAVLTRSPGAVQMLPVQPSQCVIITNQDLLPTLSYRFWLDNMYLRVTYHNAPRERKDTYVSLVGLPQLHWPLRGEGKRFVTRTTFQGDGTGPAVGIWANEDVYIENCTFANLGGDATTGCGNCSAAVISEDGNVSIAHSTFFDPSPFPGATYIRAWASGSVLLTNNEFAIPPAANRSRFYARSDSTVYSDDPTIRIASEDGGLAPPLPAAAAPAGNATNPTFLNATDPWLTSTADLLNRTLPDNAAYPAPMDPVPLLEVEAEAPSALAPAVSASLEDAPRGAGDGDDGLPTSAIIAIIVPIVLLLLLCFAACCALRWHRKRRAAAAKAAAEKQAAAQNSVGGMVDSHSGVPTGGAVSSVPWDKTSTRSDGGMSTVGSALAPQPSRATSTASTGPGGVRPTLLNVHSAEGSRAGSTVAMPVPAVGAPLSVKLTFMQSQLDSLGPEDTVMSQFHLLGPSDRRQGSHSVVAFAKGAYDCLPYAIKFFAARERFDAELAVRRDETIAALAPRIQAVHDPSKPDPATGPTSDRFGRPLPPCIVVARGESLTEWSRRATPDVFQAVAVLAHVANRLRDLHASQHVHRDVKPAHIILLPRENRWTVVDFDRAAATGAAVPPDYTLDYVPPEVLAAAEARDPTIAAEPSQDAWALGVVAFELLTNKKAFASATDGAAAVKAQLLGEAPLPWEGDRLCAETRQQLGIFCHAVLGLLQRDPAKRDAMQDFCNTCNDVVMSHTTVAAQ
eukprot:jgi/Ulvmu1/11948/UM082_0027.1